ncbi:hypothetical protein S2M10_42520 [Sphingomonas sp. S2M10]|nr:hypothetical protein [Sphingomonas sp. S2M10]
MNGPVAPAATRAAPDRLKLPAVTLCAVTSVNVAATLAAVECCISQIQFGAVVILTDADLSPPDPEIRVVAIPRICSAEDYSTFMIKSLHAYVETSHCLVVQWDGHVLSAGRWRPEFLDYDYIGARWPQFRDGADVGNGGFSLRSRRLLDACATGDLPYAHPEDLAICRAYRPQLEEQGLRFAPPDVADRFSTERAGLLRDSFGYHGVFNMPRALGAEQFWRLYRSLDSRGSVVPDFWAILFQVARGTRGWRRAALLILHRLRAARPVRWVLR